MRCLTLADYLRRQGGSVSFISRELSGNLCHLTEQKGFTIHRLPSSSDRSSELRKNLAHGEWLDVDSQTDAEETKAILRQCDQPIAWLIIDHYALDHLWETQMRFFAKNIMVIDDIADRHHECDVLLDQNLYQDMETRYDGLVPVHCRKLLGPAFALLRSEFVEARKKMRLRDGSVKRILVCFGGSDPTNETEKTLDAIRLLDRSDIFVDVVVGMANPYKDRIKALCASLPNTRYYCQIDNIAEMLNNADLTIGAGGATTWERYFLSVPALVISVAENQIGIARAAAGAIRYLGPSDSVTAHEIAKQLQLIVQDPASVLNLSRAGSRLVDGLGTERVLSVLMATK